MTDSYAARKAAGDAHEARVTGWLQARGWAVDPWGQEILSPPVRRAVSGTPWRYFPDLVAARGGALMAVDCKTRMPGSPVTGRYAVRRDCVDFGVQFVAAFRVPLVYVLGDLGVLTPQDVWTHGQVTAGMPGRGAYYLVPAVLAREFDVVFGVRPGAEAA